MTMPMLLAGGAHFVARRRRIVVEFLGFALASYLIVGALIWAGVLVLERMLP